MTTEEKTEIGKALLVIGGAVLAGKVLLELLDDEPTRETRQSTSGKGKKTQKKDVSLKGTKRFLVEIPQPKQQKNGITRSGVSESRERKYPDFYYSLPKSQQYKYRLKLSKANQIGNSQT